MFSASTSMPPPPSDSPSLFPSPLMTRAVSRPLSSSSPTTAPSSPCQPPLPSTPQPISPTAGPSSSTPTSRDRSTLQASGSILFLPALAPSSISTSRSRTGSNPPPPPPSISAPLPLMRTPSPSLCKTRALKSSRPPSRFLGFGNSPVAWPSSSQKRQTSTPSTSMTATTRALINRTSS